MLRATKQALARGGTTAFFTIHEAPGLSPRQRRHARAAGPPAVGTRSDYPRLLRSAGYTAVEAINVTDQFRATALSWLRESDLRAAELAPLDVPGAFEERQQGRRAQVAAIDDGVLQRSLFLARRA